MLLHIMKADELSPRRAADTELGPGGLQQEDVGSPSGVRAYGQGAQAWAGAWEDHVRGADNHLLNSSLPTKPGFQATSSRQLSRVPPALSSSVLLPLRDAPKAPHLQSHIIWRHTHWVSPRGRGRPPSPLATGTAVHSKRSWIRLGSPGWGETELSSADQDPGLCEVEGHPSPQLRPATPLLSVPEPVPEPLGRAPPQGPRPLGQSIADARACQALTLWSQAGPGSASSLPSLGATAG